jgi:hypothetical protein
MKKLTQLLVKDLEAAVMARAMTAVRPKGPLVLELTRRVVPYDTGSMASTIGIDWHPDGFDWTIGAAQGDPNYVDYHRVVDGRQGFIDAAVIPAIRDALT